MVPSLTDLLQICAAAGLLIGAIVGFMLRAKSDSALVNNIIASSALGAIAGTAIAFAIALGAALGPSK